MFKTLMDSGQYSAAKIFIAHRIKDLDEEIKLKTIGHHAFIGDIHAVRSHLLSMAKVIFAIGGNTKTKQEILMAQERNIPVIPVGMSNGTALHVWKQYQQNGHIFNSIDFAELNNSNPFIASRAVINIINALIPAKVWDTECPSQNNYHL